MCLIIADIFFSSSFRQFRFTVTNFVLGLLDFALPVNVKYTYFENAFDKFIKKKCLILGFIKILKIYFKFT